MNTDMCPSISSQIHDSGIQSVDSSHACSKLKELLIAIKYKFCPNVRNVNVIDYIFSFPNYSTLRLAQSQTIVLLHRGMQY